MKTRMTISAFSVMMLLTVLFGFGNTSARAPQLSTTTSFMQIAEGTTTPDGGRQ